jgi:peptidoglycan/LPS O-acetylase OafA/YrhL
VDAPTADTSSNDASGSRGAPDGFARPDRPAGDAHFPQLDSLRTLAIAGVLYAHFTGGPLNAYAGAWGVRLFFVLSGFLITGILLRLRDDGAGARGSARKFGVFYARRFLRIVPVYYALLAAAWIVGVHDVRRALGWHALYLSNFHVAVLGYYPLETGHFWSLSVEEQFYLVWPLLILLLPRSALGPAIVATIGVGPLSRYLMTTYGVEVHTIWTHPVAVLDTLGFGALLAWSAWNRGAVSAVPRWLSVAVVPAAVLLLLTLLPGAPVALWVLDILANGVIFAWMVAHTSVGVRGPIGRVLSWPPLMYLGRISYGIYLFHMFVRVFGTRAFEKLGLVVPPAVAAVVFTVLSVVAAALSWHAFERPINALKRYFPYERAASRSISFASRRAKS